MLVAATVWPLVQAKWTQRNRDGTEFDVSKRSFIYLRSEGEQLNMSRDHDRWRLKDHAPPVRFLFVIQVICVKDNWATDRVNDGRIDQTIWLRMREDVG